MQQASWRSLASLSSGLGRIDRFLGSAPFDRVPWLAVAFGTGIAAWFALPRASQWLALVGGGLALALGCLLARPLRRTWPFLMGAGAGLGLALAAGCGIAWIRSATTGTPAIARPVVATLLARTVEWRDQPAIGRARLTLLVRDPLTPERAIRVRITVPLTPGMPRPGVGALVRVRARLMPPGPPLVPGGYDFARVAWFAGLAATGTALGPVEILQPGGGSTGISRLRQQLDAHIAHALAGSAGGIAAALTSGDRGAIVPADEDAMRDAGLSHLLSVSGLHVSAVIGAAYVLTLRLLALWPWLALRVRLPLLAAGAGAGAGIFYTLLTGAEVPTLRSTIGALLALVAIALGREPLSLRLLAAAAFAVMLPWPEAVIGPSFQLSFGAALAIVALHGTAWMQRLGPPAGAAWWQRLPGLAASLLVTGIVVELALLPIGLFHFHRAGLYGALANIVAIPLTTFVTMPLVALALLLDLAGLGQPVWWLAGASLHLLLALAHLVARQPGAVTLLPAMGNALYALFLGGGLWLALWSRPVRRWGLLPIAAGTIGLAALHPADVLVSGDGRIVAFTSLVPGRLVLLRPTRSEFVRQSLAEQAAVPADPPTETSTDRPGGPDSDAASVGRVLPLDAAPGARCNPDYCLIDMGEGRQMRRFLLSRASDPAPVRDLVATCARVDVVIADRRLPQACRPTWLKADRAMLDAQGGLALRLRPPSVETVRAQQGEHGWWRPVSRPVLSGPPAAANVTPARSSPPSTAPSPTPLP